MGALALSSVACEKLVGIRDSFPHDGAPADRNGGGDGDGGGDVRPDAICPAPDGATPPTMTGTAYAYLGGPNNGDLTGMANCAYPNGRLPTGVFFAGVETSLFAMAARCGVCMLVDSGLAKAEVQIIDQVQPLTSSHGLTIAIDKTPFMMLAAGAEQTDVTFSFIPCSKAGNIQVKFRSPQDPAAVLMGHRTELKSVRLTTPATAVNLRRSEGNEWEPPVEFTFSGGAVSLILTDIHDQSLTLPSTVVSSTLVDTGVQFPLPTTCP